MIEYSTTKTTGVDGMTAGIKETSTSTTTAHYYYGNVSGLSTPLEGKYYIRYKTWVQDSNNKSETHYGVSTSQYTIDDKAPTLTISFAGSSTAWQKNSRSLKITASDGLGLSTSNSYQYYLSTIFEN